jgi:hypothetical protein
MAENAVRMQYLRSGRDIGTLACLFNSMAVGFV